MNTIRVRPQLIRQFRSTQVSHIEFHLYDDAVANVPIAGASLSLSHYGGDGYIGRVWTNEAFRNRGYCKALMKAIVEYARENSVAYMHLDVWSQNLPAIKAYQAAGFEFKNPKLFFTRNYQLESRKTREFAMKMEIHVYGR